MENKDEVLHYKNSGPSNSRSSHQLRIQVDLNNSPTLPNLSTHLQRY